MELITKVLLGLYFVIAIAMVILILLQRGRGSDLGAVFGGGSQSVFGSRGSANFLTRITAVLATLFFGIALSLAYIYTGAGTPTSVTDTVIEEVIGGLPQALVETEAYNSEIPKIPE
jgi:preprotein translocase subunit SecG